MALLVLGGAVRATNGTTTRVSVEQCRRASHRRPQLQTRRSAPMAVSSPSTHAPRTWLRMTPTADRMYSCTTARVAKPRASASAAEAWKETATACSRRSAPTAASSRSPPPPRTSSRDDTNLHSRRVRPRPRDRRDDAGQRGQRRRGRGSSASNRGDQRRWSLCRLRCRLPRILLRGDTNCTLDVFVHDRETGETTRVSVDSAGTQGNGWSSDAAISADGRFVAFMSRRLESGCGRRQFRCGRVRARPRDRADDPGQREERRCGGERQERPAVDQCRWARRRLHVLRLEPGFAGYQWYG